MEKTSLSAAGGIIAAIVASLCCIVPVLWVFFGVSSNAAFSMFEVSRPYFIGVTVVLIGLSFYFTYRKREVKCDDGTCKVVRASRWNRIGLWSATIIAGIAIAVPYLGLTPSTSFSKSIDNTSLNLVEDATFFTVPLVCDVAPHIGCGSRAKFIMTDLLKDAAVKEAWLNRAGTIMAVVWKPPANAGLRERAIQSIFSRHELPIDQVSETDRNSLVEEFVARDGWYMGSDVDALSIEEAGVIADQIVAAVSKQNRFKKEDDKAALREELKNIFQRCFLSIRSFADLNDSTFSRIEGEVIASGEKYVGKGNMPRLRRIEDCCEQSDHHAGCCSKGRHGEADE